MRVRFAQVAVVAVAVAALTSCGASPSERSQSEAVTTVVDTEPNPTAPTSTTSPSSTIAAPPVTSQPPTTAVAPPADHGRLLVGRTFNAGETFVRFERRDDGDVVAWHAACNVQGASVRVLQTKLDVGDDVSSSQVGCPSDALAADDALSTFMEADPEWSLEGGRLTLRVGADTKTFDEA